MDGTEWESVNVTSGVRQGCPLSPLLFLIAVEPLLRKLCALRTENTFRAYADDIGAVVEDLARDMPDIIRVFNEFEEVSGLRINVDKTIVIPARHSHEIDDQTTREYEEMMAATQWAEIKVATEGKYLGFLLGMKVDRLAEYASIVSKMESRLASWRGHSRLGLFDKFRIWNIYAISKLGYVDQLLTQPEEIQRRIESLLTKWIGGPNGWMTAEIAVNLKEGIGFPVAPRRAGAANLAAKTRARIDLTPMGQRLMRDISNSVNTIAPMGYKAHPSVSLWHTDYELGEIRLKRDGILSQAAERGTRARVSTPNGWQAMAYMAINKNWRFGSPARLSISIRNGLENHLTRHLQNNYSCYGRESKNRTKKWIRNFQIVSPSAPPRMLVALLRCGLHGWFTKHRFGENGACTLCKRYNDSLYHTINCSVVRRLWRKLIPDHVFDGLELLGFVEREHNVQVRIDCLCLMFGLYEFVRFWSHANSTHNYTHTSLPIAIIHFAITSISQHRNPHITNTIQRMRAMLSTGIP